MESKSTGVWHAFYGGLLVVLLMVGLVFSGAAPTAPTAERGLMAVVGVIAFALFPAVISFWILAAANAAAIRRCYEHRIQSLKLDYQAELESHEERGKSESRREVVLLYELASEFLNRFADHYFQVAADHPDKRGNRQNCWLVIVYISSIANQIAALGDESRARGLKRLLQLQIAAVPAGIENGGEWVELRNTTDAVLAGGKVPVKRIPVEYLEAARSTRLLDYVVEFAEADAA